MKIFLAALSDKKWVLNAAKPKYALESFFYLQDWQKKMITESEMFLLDSGAFTFMNSAKTVNIDLKQYIDKYCNFIVENDIKYFFELDIDSVVGYEKVKEIRKYIEDKTKRRSIPVWHRSRGLDEFIRLTEEYDYIAIGGIVTKEIKKKRISNLHETHKNST